MKWGFLDDDSGYFYCIIYNSFRQGIGREGVTEHVDVL